MSKNNKYKPPIKAEMRYAADGTPLGYLWQTHPDFDPFAEWRERWKKQPAPAKPKTKKAQPSYGSTNPYGYGEGRYMGD